MANYYAAARSNYFKVKDEDAFLAAMEALPDIEVNHYPDRGFMVLSTDFDCGAWPRFTFDDDGNDIEIEVWKSVSEHLADGEVAIFVESGHEKLRYVGGYAVAINNKQEERVVNLTDIYELAKELAPDGAHIEVAES